ncbi:MAG: GtrA family protein [Actinomycetota bacterium]
MANRAQRFRRKSPLVGLTAEEPDISRRSTAIVDAVGLGIVFGILLAYLHPGLLLSTTTTTGGDTGAHIYPAWYLKTHLLPRGQVFGWSPDWYAGFPILQLYFPFVPLLQALLSFLIPYEVAFKIGTVLGTLFLPVAAYLLFRLLDFRFPGPLIAAVSTLPYLFAKSYTIYGGNIASSLSGEYGFALSLGLVLVFIGLAYRLATSGSGSPLLCSAVLALAVLSHALPVLAVLPVIVWFVLWIRRRWAWGRAVAQMGSVLLLAFCLTAFWSVPFVSRLPYASSLRWTPLRGFGHLLPAEYTMLGIAAAVGAILGIAGRDRRILVLATPAISGAAGYLFLGGGSVWNARFLPFWYLGLVLCAAYAVYSAASWLASSAGPVARRTGISWLPTSGAVVVVGALLVATGGPLIRDKGRTFVSAWVRWDYEGYEGKAAYPQFRALMDRISDLGPGRVMWEPSRGYTPFGTTDALMTIPYFAGHPTMEGVYYESSITMPFHFLMAAEVADRPFNPIAGLPYRTFDFSRGIEHMRLFGVRYYVAWSDAAKAAAGDSPGIHHVDDAGYFSIFELARSPQVSIPAYQPVVLTGGDWTEENIRWFSDPEALGVPLVRDGPKDWPRIERFSASLARKPLQDGGRAIHARVGDEEISFTTDAVGQPHWVKTSYFPNWTVEGADGPYLASPSLMIVVPTQRHVTLRYERAPPEWFGLVLTGMGLIGLLVPPFRRRLRALGRGETGPRDLLPSGLRDRIQGRFGEFVRFGIVSVVATVVDLAVFNAFLLWVPAPLAIDVTFAYTAGLATSFVLNRRFTFAGRGRSAVREAALFGAVSLLGLAVNTGAVELVARFVGEDALPLNLARLVAAGTVWGLKFFAIDRWVFPERAGPVPTRTSAGAHPAAAVSGDGGQARRPRPHRVR